MRRKLLYYGIHDDVQEKERRVKQIDKGQLCLENGLVYDHQVTEGKYATIVRPREW